ncbi:MAG: hypothetical protein HZB16_21130 [Armatimonadetes bacterium]|nr:hypothetical protein [Armatimonadota bacterium]
MGTQPRRPVHGRQRIDGNNLTCNFAYNEAGGALTNVSYPTQSSYNVTYGHDALGRVTSMSDAQGTIATTYDDLGNPLTVTTTYTGLDPQVVEYTYYPNGQRASMNTPGGLFEYEYSVNGAMTQLDGPAGTASWTWLDNQQLGARTLPCGAWSEFTYLPNGRLSTLTNKDDQGNVMSRYLDLQYRGTGDLAHWEARVTGSTSHSGETDYTYDLRRELTGETSERNGGYSDAYAYDNAGNPTSWRGATRTFNSNNQETTGANWTYDGNGNPTSYGGTTCTYDVANHLTAHGSEFTAGYRGDGLRAWQQSGGTRKYYVYDGWRPVCELDSSGTVLRSWTFGADGLVACGSEQALCDWQGNAAHWWNGSTWTLGAVLGGYGAAGSGYKWLHGYLDCGEDLILCAYRHLDPALGRWLTRDPIGYRGGVGLYGYVGNSPSSRIDPSGRCGGGVRQVPGLHGFLGYGNYCGPYVGDRTFQAPALDPVDSCCKAHDWCFQHVPGGCGGACQLYKSECAKCTETLARCLLTADCGLSENAGSCEFYRQVAIYIYGVPAGVVLGGVIDTPPLNPPGAMV